LAVMKINAPSSRLQVVDGGLATIYRKIEHDEIRARRPDPGAADHAPDSSLWTSC
jgi:hypothetical protein